MLVTNHVLSGALVGAACPGPVSAFLTGAASHFTLDALPHWGDVDWEEMVPIGVRDGLTGLGVIAILGHRARAGARLRVLAGIAGACLPDLDKPAILFFGRSPFPDRFDDFHLRIQRESRDRMPQELLVGAVLMGIAWRLLPRAEPASALIRH